MKTTVRQSMCLTENNYESSSTIKNGTYHKNKVHHIVKFNHLENE